ncbi:MAG: hypothetical protein IKU00_09050 [Bacteroidales bacterium]|nr:hypothetical protein [Bacteroidales bacterium]
MKRITIFLLSVLFAPAMLFAQLNVSVSTEGSTDLKVTVPGYNERIPAAVMNLKFEFDQETETLLVRMGSTNESTKYDKIWLPQNDIPFGELSSYMNNRGVKMVKSNTFVDQENFLNLSSKTINAAIQCTGMSFTGVYDLKSPKKVKKQLDHQMVPLDGKMELDLKFKVFKGVSRTMLKLRNPIPMDRSGRKGILAFMADDIVINIKLERCKDAEQLIQTIQEYEALFQVAEDKLNELKRNPSTQKAYKEFVLRELSVIDMGRFRDADCEDVQSSYQSLMNCIDRINDMGSSSGSGYGYGSGTSQDYGCDVNALNKEIKSTTSSLNNLVNDWSLAGSAAAKAEKKAAFDAAVKRFDDKLNSLPAGCKNKLDQKLIKNYEFVKKLVK